MGLFDFLSKNSQPEVEQIDEKYWSLTTGEGEVTNPTWDQIEEAVENATCEGTMFVSLGYINSGLDFEVIQAVCEDRIYRVEALPRESSLEQGNIYVKDGLTHDETMMLFKTFFNHRRIIGLRDWLLEKNR